MKNSLKPTSYNIVALTSLLLVLGMYVLHFTDGKKNKIAFIDIGKLVSEYKFKKDLETSASQGIYKIKNVVDSLDMIRKVAGHERIVDTQLSYARFALKQYYEQVNEEVTKKVWERLNPAIEQYGKEKKIKMLIGANGAGTVLYGSPDIDATEDLIRYINSKYEKGS